MNKRYRPRSLAARAATIALVSTFVATVIAGCERPTPKPPRRLSSPPIAPAPPTSEPSLGAQVKAVRDGMSEVIVLEETLVKDVDLKRLTLGFTRKGANKSLLGLTDLKELTLRKTQLTDDSDFLFPGLASLKTLILGDTEYNDATARQLATLTSLQTLNINKTQMTNEGLRHLSQLSELELLRLGSSQIDDNGLVHLQGMKRLKYLFIQNARLTDAGLEHLKPLTSLESLYLEGNEITSEGVERVFPRLHVHW